MKKLKVLVVPSDRTGVSFYRSTSPHIALEKNYPDEFHIDIDYEPQIKNDEWLKQYDIIHYHRTLGPYEEMASFVKRLKSLGIISIMDLDDYWAPGNHHPAYVLIKKGGLDIKIRDNLKVAQYITTTTPIFAAEISRLNNNVFVLPNAIDPTEPQFISKPEPSDKLRIGWLGGSCMIPEMEILTDEGWKRFDNLNQTEQVATLNPNTNHLEFKQPTNYICEPFDGYLNCAKTSLIEYEVTPNHNMYASEAKNLGHKKLDLNLVLSEKIHRKNFHVKRDANWVGTDTKYFTLPSLETNMETTEETYIDKLVKKSSKRYNYLFEKYCSDKDMLMDDWLMFFGFWLAEGWTSKTKGLHQVGVAQTKDNNYLEIMFNTLLRMGFNPKYTKDKKQIRVFDKQLWDYLSDFGQASEKHIPEEILSLCPRQLNILLKWFINGDGHVENNKYKRTRAFTSSKQLADNLQELALKIGITATINNRGKRTSQIKGRQIINQYDSLVVNFSKHPDISKYNKATPLVKTEQQYTKYYKGNVYCVEVENHIIYVRKNGKAFWIGNSHLKDLELLNGVVNKLETDGLLNKIQFVLCGFDLRGHHTVVDQKTGEQTTRPIQPMESVWYQYERIFTDDYKAVSPKYKDYLLKFKAEDYPDVANEPYRRVWTKPISSYAINYNLFDVSLAPLSENTFNKCKSQLKVIEAGFHHKAIVTQDFGPYQIDLKNALQFGGGFDMSANSILVKTERNHKDWYAAIKKLVSHPEYVKALQDNLYETVKNTYSIDKVTEDRKNLYLSLVAKNKPEMVAELTP